MSNTDSFIDEVTEELRRDQLFRAMRRYGWIAVLLVTLLVGGAAVNEFRKARSAAEAQAFGDSVITALRSNDTATRLAALDRIEAEGDRAGILNLLKSGEALATDDRKAAEDALAQIALDSGQPMIYRQLAEFKLILIQQDGLPPAERMSRLQSLSNGPFRLLAEEQMALTEIDSGDRQAALERLQNIIADGEVTPGLRRRAAQLIVALGGSLAPA